MLGVLVKKCELEIILSAMLDISLPVRVLIPTN
jgi:hypothetical protein